MNVELYSRLQQQLADLTSAGLFKQERGIAGSQGATVRVGSGTEVINLCANNYLGLASDPRVVAAAHRSLDDHGFGMASVRFICGTLDLHQQLEARLSGFLHTEATILYSSCFDANGGLFETILGEQDAVISDSLNHASIIDGIRLCKARKYRYANRDLNDLEQQLRAAADARTRLIITDGVFSMDGTLAPLADICRLARQYDALVAVDDSHATGFMGTHGRGTPEHAGVMDQVDILTGTLGKALGGAAGGYISGRKTLIDYLRQRSRPYLFSNSVAPVIVGTTLAVLDLIEANPAPRQQLHENARFFRSGMTDLGFKLLPGEHPIIPVMIGDAALASRLAQRLLELGVFVVGFSFPVVPQGLARIRTQMCAAHTTAQLTAALAAFAQAGREFGLIPHKVQS